MKFDYGERRVGVGELGSLTLHLGRALRALQVRSLNLGLDDGLRQRASNLRGQRS